MSDELRVLAIGDAMGRPGRAAVKKLVPEIRKEAQIDFVICNGENSAGGKGITQDTARELLDSGVDVITTGNHVWHNKDIFRIIDTEQRLLRPANLPQGLGIPGRGFGVYESESGFPIAVMNLLGRVHMECSECPFRMARSVLQQLRDQTPIIFVDFHAEVTSEKVAMGWFLDGQVSGIFGTHTHVQTADERLLHHGTAYITDLGMTGGHDSVIGITIDPVIDRFLRGLPIRHEVSEKNVKLSGVIITVDPLTGRAKSIERVLKSL